VTWTIEKLIVPALDNSHLFSDREDNSLSPISGSNPNKLSTLANLASYTNALAIINLSNGSLCTGDKLTALQETSGVNGNKQIPVALVRGFFLSSSRTIESIAERDAHEALSKCPLCGVVFIMRWGRLNLIQVYHSHILAATGRFSRFSTFQSRIANAHPPLPSDIIELVNRTIENTQAKIPALERSIQEIKQEGELS
jgi:hypothetical protein